MESSLRVVLRLTLPVAACFFLCGGKTFSQPGSVDVVDLPTLGTSSTPLGDYLVSKIQQPAAAYRSADGKELVLDNGLIRRAWRVQPNAACVAFDNLTSGQSMLRSVRPEARITLDGVAFDVGGLVGQPNHAFLKPAWLDAMQADSDAMRFVGFEIGKPAERFSWGRRRHAEPNAVWPPKGVYLRMDFEMPPLDEPSLKEKLSTGEAKQNTKITESSLQEHLVDLAHVRVSVHYELYDGVPVMSKWVTVHNGSQRPITVDRFTAEQLALVEHASWVEFREGVPVPRPEYLHVETDFAFGGFNPENANRHVVHWRNDPLYMTQVNWARENPCFLVCEPTYGPSQTIQSGETFESFRTFELAYDSSDRERRSLALRRMYRTIAPWVTENPITHHLLSNSASRVREAIDQAAEVGFEAIILSFGSGFNMENRDPAFIETWRAVADYAEEKGVELGSYSLFSSRDVGKEHMIVPPEGQSPTHGRCPAVTSEWGQEWLETMRAFYEQTGYDQFENDGPYPGDVDVTVRPPLQKGSQDSRWVQWRMTSNLYRDLRKHGVFINAPDYYYLSGSNKCGMGYREVNWSLPREHQVIHTRQNIYDGTWNKTPSMGWMFVPLSQYHGGGAAATIEPLNEHLVHYRAMMLSNLALGVQAHYRGPRLFDTEATRDMVKETVAWFKRYREVLEADVVHGRRADGRDLDWMLHINPHGNDKGMLVVFNPLPKEVSKTITVNLYYTGLTDEAQVLHEGQFPQQISLARDYSFDLDVRVPAQGMTWYVLQ